MNLIGDGIHNFVDGILIASSFLVDPGLGMATTIAIVLHEIPQEISDTAIPQGGYGKERAVFFKLLLRSRLYRRRNVYPATFTD